MQVAPMTRKGSSMDQMHVATRMSSYASVLTKGGQQAARVATDGQKGQARRR